MAQEQAYHLDREGQLEALQDFVLPLEEPVTCSNPQALPVVASAR